jgi:tetratricopeptide (TPR) repeat protein
MSTNSETVGQVEAAERALKEGTANSYQFIEPVLTNLKDDKVNNEQFTSDVLTRLVKVLRNLILKEELKEESSEEIKEEINEKKISRWDDQLEQVVAKGLRWYPKDVRLLNEQGWIYYFRNQYEKAYQAFEDAVSNFSSTTDKEDQTNSLQGAGASLRELRRFREADVTLARSFATGEQPASGILIERGWLSLYQEKSDLAFVDFEKALSTADEEDKTEIMSGQLAACLAAEAQNSIDKKSKGKKLANGWRTILPKKRVLRILAKCGEALSYLNNYSAALLAYDLTLEIDPENQEALENKIAALKWLRRFDQAEQVYRSAQKFPYKVKLWNEMANTYYRQKQFQEAYDYYSGEALTKHTFHTEQAGQKFGEELKKDEDAIEWTVVSLRKMGRLADAEKKIDEALALFPDKVNFLGERAAIYFSKQEYNTAIAVFEQVLNIDEYNEFALQWRAASFRKQGKFDEAREAIEEAVRRVPASAGLWEELAWLNFDQNDFKKSEECFAEAIKIDKYLIQIQFSRAKVLTRLNRNDDALEVFRVLEDQFPEDVEVAEQLGWFYLGRGNLTRAKEEFLSIWRRYPNNVLAINGLGGTYLEERDYRSAEKAFLLVLKQVKYEPQYHLNLAWSLVRQVRNPGELPKSECSLREKLLDEAAASCRNALKLDPYNSKAYVCLGVIAFKRNAFLDAEGYFRKSLDLNPKEDSHVELGSLYVQMGRYEEAKEEFTEAIKVNDNDARAYIEMGNLLLLMGSNTEAVRECRKAVSIDPTTEETHRALAIALMRAGEYDEAEKALRTAMNTVVRTKQWQLHLMLSQILIRLGDDKNKDQDLYGEALRHVSEAKRMNSEPNAEIYFHEGIAQFKLEDYQRSYKSFKDCLKANRDRFEAERYSRVVKAMIHEQKRVLRVNTWAGLGLAAICVLMLSLMATFYYRGTTRVIPEPELSTWSAEANTSANESVEGTDTGASERSENADKPKEELIVDKSMLTFMIPLLMGLLVVALMLPNLNKLKLPGGFEAEISEPKTRDISSGPKGDIGFGSSLPIISPGPR